MPRTHPSTGLIVAGIGETGVSIDRVVCFTGGASEWFNADELVAARKTGPTTTDVVACVKGSLPRQLDPGSAAEIAGSGFGHWSARNGQGVRSNVHPTLPLAGLRCMGPDGTLAYCRSYQSGLGLILRALDGATTTLVGETAACRDVQVHSATEATWVQGGRLLSTYGNPVTPEGRCGVPRVVLLNGQRRLLYWHSDDQGERLLLQMSWTKPEGYVLTKPGQVRDGKADWPAFRPDMIALAGQLKACWSVTEAEGPPSIRELAIDLARPVVDLRRAAVPVPPPVPPPSPQTPKVTIASYPTTVSVGQGARAVALITQGKENAQKFLWRYRQAGTDWKIVARNSVSDDDHTFFNNNKPGTFYSAGVYYIGVDVTDLTGKVTNGTQQERKITVTA